MFCHKCGAPLPDGSRFCSACGEKLPETAGTASAAAAETASAAAAPARPSRRMRFSAQPAGKRQCIATYFPPAGVRRVVFYMAAKHKEMFPEPEFS